MGLPFDERWQVLAPCGEGWTTATASDQSVISRRSVAPITLSPFPQIAPSWPYKGTSGRPPMAGKAGSVRVCLDGRTVVSSPSVPATAGPVGPPHRPTPRRTPYRISQPYCGRRMAAEPGRRPCCGSSETGLDSSPLSLPAVRSPVCSSLARAPSGRLSCPRTARSPPHRTMTR